MVQLTTQEIGATAQIEQGGHPGTAERDLLAWLAVRGVPALVALTKSDKLAPMRRTARARELAASLELPPEQVIATSAQSKLGIDVLWKALGAWL